MRSTRDFLSPDAPADGFTRRFSLRARSLFTRPWPLFLERVCRAYSRPDVAYRLLQLRLRRASNQTRALRSSQGRRPRPPSFSSAPHALSLAGAVRRGEPRSVHPPQPRCRLFLLAQVCPTAMPTSDAAPPAACADGVSDDRRARVLGPSEGRVISWRAARAPSTEWHVLFIAHADDVPLLGDQGTSAVVGA